MVQSFDKAKIESIMLVAKLKDNAATFTINVKDVATNLARVDELNLCKGVNSDIDLDTSFTLSMSDAEKDKLEGLLLIEKYKF